MHCEMCGSNQSILYKTMIEGSQMNVCEKCGKFGKKIGEVKEQSVKEKARQEKRNEKIEDVREVMYKVKNNYAAIIRNARNKLGLSNEEFSKKLSEKESLISHIENGKTAPSLALARKLERTLGIKLVEEYEEKHEKYSGNTAGEMTLGDLIKNKL